MNREELDAILNGYSWIKVKQLGVTPRGQWAFPTTQYLELEAHHEKETKFLIVKVRELAQEVYNLTEGGSK